MKKKGEDDPDAPAISKELPIIKWVEAFRDHLNRCIGVRHVPLVCVMREDENAPATVPVLAPNQPYSIEYGLIEDKLIARADHTDGLFRNNNMTACFKLEEAARGAQCAATIKPFQRAHNGRKSFLSLEKQFAGVYKWELELKKQDSIHHNRKWRGKGNNALQRFCQYLCNAYAQMASCSQHVAYQLPNEHTYVGYLLDVIECNSPPLQAAIANIEDDKGDGTPVNPRKRNDFELAVSYLLPKDPVAKRVAKSPNKRGVSEISDATTSNENGELKKGMGKTGVHLR